MNRGAEFRAAQGEIDQETDAEIAFGRYLEQSGVDCDDFMAQWNITQSQFNRISHFVYGLSDDLSMLPGALAALLLAGRGRPIAA